MRRNHDLSLQNNLTNTDSKIPDRIINASEQEFRDKFNQKSFQFAHNLAEHPLFQLPRLVELATFTKSKGIPVACLSGKDVRIEAKWSDREFKEGFAEAIANLAESGSSILISDIQLDPEYNVLLEKILDELEQLTGAPLREQASWLGAYIFMASPNSITNYHIDHESNFLFQIHGVKEDYLFDQSDRSVLTESELEAFYIGDIESANFTEEKQLKSTLYRLTPGIGVHHPVMAPHWVKTTAASYAVTLSIVFYLRKFDLRAKVYQVNYFLRKLGLIPTPPDQSAWRDWFKIHLIGLFSKSHPTTKSEIVRSGIMRIKKYLRWLKR